jgi:hypothetical protein
MTHILEEDLEDTTGLFVVETENMLHTMGEMTDSGLVIPWMLSQRILR